MPVNNSRLKGFYKLTVDERRQLIAESAQLQPEQVAALAKNGELDWLKMLKLGVRLVRHKSRMEVDC